MVSCALMSKFARYPPPLLASYGQEENRRNLNGKLESSMDPDTLPRPSEAHELSRTETVREFDSDKFNFPPSSTTDFVCIDSGSATLRFARPTTNHVPSWPSLQVSAALPLACHFQPFADVHEQEDAVMIAESSSSSGAFRCGKCSAFVNPHFTWFEEGQKAKCNMCEELSEVPLEYRAPTNAHGHRSDKYMRVELRNGSVDFVPARDTVNAGFVPVTVFVIDTTHMSFGSGFLLSILSALRENLERLPIESEVGFILFDENIHFVRFEFSRNGSPSLLTVSDVDDPFIPEHASCLMASPHLLTEQMLRVFDLVESFSAKANPNRAVSCAVSAVSVAVELLAEKGGGSVVVFQASRCGSEKDLKFLSKKCLDNRISVDLFAPCNQSGTSVLCPLVARVKGELYSGSKTDIYVFLSRHLNREKFYDCLIRVRASTGLVIDDVDNRGSESTCAFPRLVSDSSICVSFSVSKNISPNKALFLQMACLYSKADGARLIRVHTVMLNSSAQIGPVFKYADSEAIGLWLAKRALALSLQKKSFSVRDFLTTSLVVILHAYRTQCAANSPSGQLILPDSLKTLPLQISGILKQVGIADKNNTVLSDESNFNFFSIAAYSISQGAYNFLPRCFCLPELRLVPSSRHKLSPSKIFVFDLHNELLFFIGREADVEYVTGLFGSEIAQTHQEGGKNGIMDVDLGTIDPRLAAVLHTLTRNRVVTIKCALASSAACEAKISNLLIEDRLGSEPGYIDWLCLLHRLIQEKIDY